MNLTYIISVNSFSDHNGLVKIVTALFHTTERLQQRLFLCNCSCLRHHVLWFDVNIRGPGVHPSAGIMVLHLLLCPFFFKGPLIHFIFIWVYLPSAVSPHTRYILRLCLSPRKIRMTYVADPQPLSWVNVSDHRSLLGTRTADHKATFSAVVSTLGHGELVGAAHADGRGLVWDPGNSKGGSRLEVVILQQFGPAVLNVFNPSSLLFVWGGCHVEGLARCPDQPLVPHSHTVLQVLQLDVLWNDEKRYVSTTNQKRIEKNRHSGSVEVFHSSR